MQSICRWCGSELLGPSSCARHFSRTISKIFYKNNMNLIQHLDKNNLHHAYLIEGDREEVLGDLYEFIQSLGMKREHNADITEIILDAFKVDDARSLKSFASLRGVTNTKSSKKIFIITANNFLLEAQNSLLKLFEEPIENTHFFIIVPDTSIFIETILSRVYLINTPQALTQETKDAEKFIKMDPSARLNFIKDLLTEDEEEEDAISVNSPRSRALKFLNALEFVLHKKVLLKVKNTEAKDADFFEHFFKVRQFLRQPGSSTKTLMESVALVTPQF